MAEHTSGPWSHSKQGMCAVVDSNFGTVAQCRMQLAEQENLANAQFIAAAPDMLEALYMMRHDFQQLVAVPRAFQSFTRLEAAIAKAEGLEAYNGAD